MSTQGPGTIFGQIDGIASNAQGLQDVSDTQAAVMQHLGSTLEGLAPNFQGAAGAAMQTTGQQLHTHGMQISTAFANHSDMMKNNATFLTSQDAESASHIIGQVANLT